MTTTMHDTEKALQEIWDAAVRLGLDPFPTHFEVVPANIMYELGAYGIPGRFSHWTHGKAYWHMKTMYEYALSKIYELVINTNPSLAFLLDTNSLLENKMVIAHVLGHTDFFRHNMYFDHTSRQMVESASLNAERIARYEFERGTLAVEKFLDAVLSVKEHFALPAPRRRKSQDEPAPRTTPYDDLWDLDKAPRKDEEDRKPRRIPPEPEPDILQFLFTYATELEDWQRDIIAIVRQEQLYFLPQMQTKIMNEGWASYWHYKLMNDELNLGPAELAQFGALHAGVVSPGGRMRINPYYLGFRIWQDIERRWDHPTAEERERLGRKPGKGREKMFEVREAENDQSFLRHYLTEELVRDLDMYTYRLVDGGWPGGETGLRVPRGQPGRARGHLVQAHGNRVAGAPRPKPATCPRHHIERTPAGIP